MVNSMKLRSAVLVAAAWLAPAATAVDTTVNLTYSQYRGVALANGVSQWLGMRYAAAPVGGLRFMPPQEPRPTSRLQMADKHGKYCLATDDDPGNNQTAEDCLFLDVQAPTAATPQSRLPVFLYIQGGGFNENANANVNASGLVAASRFGIVVVSFNYRVGPYGFLTDGEGRVAANNGLRDQRKAMEWVQRHVGAFGGDPGHVVLGGSSAGAESVVLHMTANNGTVPAFHGAIAESPSFATTLTAAEAGYQYRQLAVRLGCAGADSLACLRNKTAAEVQAENVNVPLPGAAAAPKYMYVPVLDGDLVPDYTYRLLARGRLRPVPAILGDDSNGGTKFTPRATATLAQSNQFMLDQYPFLTLDQLGQANRLYPNGNGSAACPGRRGCYWRQVSDVYGEARYMCPARAVTAALVRAGVRRSFAYRWDVQDPAQVAAGLGVPHTVELNALWGPEYAPRPPASYRKGGRNERASPLMQRYWTNFIRTLDPNDANQTTAAWRPWSPDSQQRLVFQTGGEAQMEPFGDALNRRCDFWADNGVSMRL
ncbi:hypothetical protein CDD83_6535 [Cordyceps sp. RAO-2017]|nr:hypothetical protein CDD83_6535 [Cordyceps sp. RAO-2017]